jgi:S1-C subfamily serine protease
VYDYAILKIDSTSAFPALAVDDASVVRHGEHVACLGYPLDFDELVITSGIASAVVMRRSHWNALHKMRTIVTDALIQFGNSGGPMVNLATGTVVGVNTLKHELGDALSQRLHVWLQRPDPVASPALKDLAEYTLRYTYVGLNHAISTEYVKADPAWPT